MRIVVTGGTGFIGRALVARLLQAGHSVVAITRRPEAAREALGLGEAYAWADLTDAFAVPVDAVVHLAGESVKGYWTKAKVEEVWESRIWTTKAVVEAVAQAPVAPAVLLSASGIGYFGDAGESVLEEGATPGKDYFAQLCVEWESLVLGAGLANVRTVCARFGIVLGNGGGALPMMALPAKTGLSGPLGSGRQWWSWISLDDAVRALIHVMDRPELQGSVNVVSPEPIRQAEFQKQLGSALGRPAFIPAPAFGVRMLLGKFADEVLSSKRVVPSALAASGFVWESADLSTLLERLLRR